MCPIPALAIHEPARILPKGGEAETGAGLRRPRLLMSAARHGLGEYRRARDLLRLLGYCPNAALAVEDLTRMEAEAEASAEIAESYSGDTLKARFSELEQTAGADEDLLELKRKMGLVPPAQAPAVATRVAEPEEEEMSEEDLAELDAALEALKRREAGA